MNAIEAAIYFVIGSSSGLATGMGFQLYLVRVFYVDGGGGMFRAISYYAVMMFSCFAVGIAPILVIGGLVMNKGWEDPSAWARLLVFALGVLVGMIVAFAVASLVLRKVNELRERGLP